VDHFLIIGWITFQLLRPQEALRLVVMLLAFDERTGLFSCQPNQVWCGDIKFVWMGTRWAYLAVVMNLFARKLVGWAMSYSPDTRLAAKAL
jgi:transposase InsO family protein